MAHIGTLVARGHGYSILPLPAVAEALAAGQVSIARIHNGSIRRTLCLVRNTNQVLTHAFCPLRGSCDQSAFTTDRKVLSRLIEKGVWVADLDVALR